MDNATAHGEELPHYILNAIGKFAHEGASHHETSSVLGLKLEVVQQVLAKDPSQIVAESIASQLQGDTFPTFIYSYTKGTDKLHRTCLVTGEQSSHRVPSYQFKLGSCWSEVPGGCLLITGGGYPVERDVVRIDIRREFAVAQHPPMLTPRAYHAAVYHSQHLYILGGWMKDSSILSECERYNRAEKRWEALAPLPKACMDTSGVVLEKSLYALGGYDESYLDLVQKLSLESLTWELMQLRLPYAGGSIPCFKLRDTEVYLVVKRTLCFFTVLEVRPLESLTDDFGSWLGASYYCRGTLYCSSDNGLVQSYSLSNIFTVYQLSSLIAVAFSQSAQLPTALTGLLGLVLRRPAYFHLARGLLK
jgi:hypothetical protein